MLLLARPHRFALRRGVKHDVINTGTSPLKLYTLPVPAHHRDGAVHRTHAGAETDAEELDGKTTE